jgi:hypothetical protein
MKKFISKNGVTPQSRFLSGSNPSSDPMIRPVVGRRSFLKSLGATGAMLVPGSTLLVNQAKAMGNDDFGGKIGKGDASILRFLAAAEIIESDFWEQYWQLGGTQQDGFASTNPASGTKPTRSTRLPSSFWMRTWINTFWTIPMMSSATRTSCSLT